MVFAYDIKAEAVLRYLAGLGHQVADVRPMLLRWGQRVAKQARETARGKGGRRFWGEVARSVRVTAVSDDGVLVKAHHVAAAQKQFGGVIEAKNAKALTIPIADEAKGKRAAEFEMGGRELFVLDSDAPDTIGVLGYAEADGDFHPLFVLRRRVPQAADPWWPTGAEILQMGYDEADRWVAEKIGA